MKSGITGSTVATGRQTPTMHLSRKLLCASRAAGVSLNTWTRCETARWTSLAATGFGATSTHSHSVNVRANSSSSSSLQQLAGLSKADLEILIQKGIKAVEDLKALQDQQATGSMSGLLQGPTSQQQQQPATAATAPKVTLAVEGNISAGKSTFLSILEQQRVELTVVPEPVSKWQAVGPARVNLLHEFYKAPERFAYTFQNYVFLTRVMQERDSYSLSRQCRLLERSVFSDRMVFVRAVHAARHMTDIELDIYDGWFDPILATLPTLIPNGFVYLRAQPETCHRRMRRRARNEEAGVPLDYLQLIHSKHEDWLWEGSIRFKDAQAAAAAAAAAAPASSSSPSPAQQQAAASSSSAGAGSSSSSASSTGGQPSHLIDPLLLGVEVPASIQDSLRFLSTQSAACLHPRLHNVPALVVDCDADSDLGRDGEYARHVAQQVDDYRGYVRAVVTARAHAQHGAQQLLQPPGAHYNGYVAWQPSSGHLDYQLMVPELQPVSSDEYDRFRAAHKK